jgi:hypothetical protein
MNARSTNRTANVREHGACEGDRVPVERRHCFAHDRDWPRSQGGKNWRGSGGPLRRTPLTYQPACKPGSVGRDACAPRATAIHLRRRLPGASCNLPGRLDQDIDPGFPRAAPIRSCSRWGLPCRLRCRRRGALLPHRFTLAPVIRNAPRRSVLCGTFPRLAPAGRYPAPYVRGARTFLPGPPFGIGPRRPSGRLTGLGMGSGPTGVKCRSVAGFQGRGCGRP